VSKLRKKTGGRETENVVFSYLIRYRVGIIALLVFLIAAPALYYGEPHGLYFPDLQYVKAKTNYLLDGHLFADPVTGYPTIHPPFYHLFVAPLKLAGLDYTSALLVLLVFNIAMFFTFSYLIVKTVYGNPTAILTSLTIPFLYVFVSGSTLNLPASFAFSISFFLAGLWLLLRQSDSIRQSLLVGLLWGIAFLISPLHLFAFGPVLIYQFFFRKEYRNTLIMAVTIGVVSIPFIIQTAMLVEQNLGHSTTFSFWPGLRDFIWAGNILTGLLVFDKDGSFWVATAIAAAAVAGSCFAFLKQRRVHWFVVTSAVSFVLVSFHFKEQYAERMLLFLMLFLLAASIRFLLSNTQRMRYVLVAVLLVGGYSMLRHFQLSIESFYPSMSTSNRVRDNAWRLPGIVRGLTEPEEFIFCTKDTYRYYLMHDWYGHSLGCYRTMEYFQLDSYLAQRLQADYHSAFKAKTYDQVLPIINKYDIRIAVFKTTKKESTMLLYGLIAERWPKVFDDGYFRIFRRPE
jgi:hypothetical protein